MNQNQKQPPAAPNAEIDRLVRHAELAFFIDRLTGNSQLAQSQKLPIIYANIRV